MRDTSRLGRRDVGNGKVISRLEVLALYFMDHVGIFGIKLDVGCVCGTHWLEEPKGGLRCLMHSKECGIDKGLTEAGGLIFSSLSKRKMMWTKAVVAP